MSLISGKEAKLAWANGEKLKYITPKGWIDVNEKTETWVFDEYNFSIIQRTITINGVELNEPTSIESTGQLGIHLQFDNESERNVFLNTLLNRNF